MSSIYDGDFTVPMTVNPVRRTYPFESVGDSETYYFEQDYWQQSSYYAKQASDTPSADDSIAYLVGESKPDPVGADIVEFTRTYSRIPIQRVEFESIGWEVPGLEVGTVYALVDITSGTNASGGITNIITPLAHGLVADDTVAIYFYYRLSNYLAITAQVLRKVTAATTYTFSVGIITAPGPITYQQCAKRDIGRAAEVQSVTAQVIYDYFLPGISTGVAAASDIDTIQPSYIYDATGLKTDTYSVTTVPARATYLISVRDKSWIVAEPSSIRRWKGNIYERVTRYVQAI